jgi:hypothetical protein
LVFQSRWLLVPLYIGLIVVLALFSIKFLKQVFLLSLIFLRSTACRFWFNCLNWLTKLWWPIWLSWC